MFCGNKVEDSEKSVGDLNVKDSGANHNKELSCFQNDFTQKTWAIFLLSSVFQDQIIVLQREHNCWHTLIERMVLSVVIIITF